MGLIDFHLHFFSRSFYEALAAQSPLPGSASERLEAVAKRCGFEIPEADVEAHTARWLAQADRYDVEHLCAFASLPEEAPALAQAARVAKGRLTPFGLANPRAPEMADKVREWIDRHGFAGVLLFPALHHYHLAGPEAQPLLQVLQERRAIVYAHCGLLVVKLRDHLGLPRTQDLTYANPLGIVAAANRYPDITFVIPHFGAGFLREALLAGSQCPNVCVDSSSSNSWMATSEAPLRLSDVFQRCLSVLGAQRILFGTDSNAFPAGWRADRLAEQRAALAAAGASAADHQAIFGGNARRLLDRLQRPLNR